MTRIAINGFGRIGRCIVRALTAGNADGLEVVAVNDLTDPQTLGHLLQFDSVHGTFSFPVRAEADAIQVADQSIRVLSNPNPSELPWKELGVELVLECSGRFRARDTAMAHVQAGAKHVVISAPGKNVDATFCYGVNHETFDPEKHVIVSNASCTTNCLAPVAKVLHDRFTIEHGLMTTVHAVTNDQRILDFPHDDLRRARAAFESIIPTTTGAAKAVGLVLPELQGKLNGFAMRVPTRNVSVVDLTVRVGTSTTADAVNQALTEAAEGALAGVLVVEARPLVSIDFTGNPASSTVDAQLTEVMDGRLVKVVSWYDNEWGYAQRCIDLARHMVRQTR